MRAYYVSRVRRRSAQKRIGRPVPLAVEHICFATQRPLPAEARSSRFVAVVEAGRNIRSRVAIDRAAYYQIADPIIAIFVALVLLWSSWGVFRQSYDQLMDRELPDEERARIKAIVMRHPEVRSLHDLRTRASGVNTFIQFHIELDPECSLMRAHIVSDEVEREVCAAFPHAEVIIHQDPEGAEIQPALARA